MTETPTTTDQRTHYVTTTDGVTIGGTVHGQGPPLVFLHGMLGDGDLDWTPLMGHLADRFTCHLPSQRGRGLSGDHPNLSYRRQVDDYVAYIHSIGEPICLVSWSGGTWPALDATAQSDAVTAVASIEPESVGLADEQDRAAFGGAVERAAEIAGKGDLVAAVRPLADFVFNHEELSTLEKAGYLEDVARYIPNLLEFIEQLMEYTENGGVTADDPAVLSAIPAPVMVLHGSDAKPLAVTSSRHVADHVPNGRIAEIPGAGHAAPLTHPELLAESLTDFFPSVQQPA